MTAISAKPTTDDLWKDFLVCERAANTARSVYAFLESLDTPDHIAFSRAQSAMIDAESAEDAAHNAYEGSMLEDEA